MRLIHHKPSSLKWSNHSKEKKPRSKSTKLQRGSCSTKGLLWVWSLESSAGKRSTLWISCRRRSITQQHLPPRSRSSPQGTPKSSAAQRLRAFRLHSSSAYTLVAKGAKLRSSYGANQVPSQSVT